MSVGHHLVTELFVRFVQENVEAFGGSALHARGQVTVQIERHSDIQVTEPFQYDSSVLSTNQDQ